MKCSSFIFAILLSMLVSCFHMPQKRVTKNRQKAQGGDESKGRSTVIIKFTDSIYVKLKAIAHSGDSVIIESIFVNNWQEPFYLYKPLLPSNELLRENVFTILVEKRGGLHNVNFVFKDTSGKYYEGNSHAPVVIPELTPDNLILINPMSSLRFTINVCKFYDLQSQRRAGYKDFSIVYGADMPLINSRFEQIHEKGEEDGKTKPVFLLITTEKAVGAKYLLQHAYFRIE